MQVQEERLSQKRLTIEGKYQEQQRVASEYIERERNFLNEELKTQERPRIAAFLMCYQGAGETVRLMSLPSIHWSFEHLLMEQWPDRQFRFFGFEWTWGVLELGRAYMPGGKSMRHVVLLANGKMDGFVSINNGPVMSHWLWMQAGDFLSLQRTDKKKSQLDKFAHVYKRMTAVWLDFTSQLCSEVRTALTHVGSHLHKDRATVPVAITLMAARDNHDSDDGRVAEICLLLGRSKWRSFTLRESWKYVHNDTPMLTVTGEMTLKES